MLYFLKIQYTREPSSVSFCSNHFNLFFLSGTRWVKNQNFQEMKNHFTQVQHKSKSYYFLFLRYWLQSMDFFFVILNQFCHFTLILAKTDRVFCHFGPFFAFLPSPPLPPKKPKFRKNLEKMKKMPGDIILFRMCIINENHMMYGS